MAIHPRTMKENQLLDAVGLRGRERILAECTTVPLEFGHVLYEPGDPLRHVYFPTSGFVSLIAPDGPNHTLEVGLVGTEGMVGGTLALGIAASPLKALVQGEGTAHRMRADSFSAILNENAPRRVVGAYVYVQYRQMAQTAVCGRFHSLDARLAQWILLTHDRAGASHFRLTHQFLAHMLGVRRAGVTMAAGSLQKQHLIQYRRGMMNVLNRPGLEAVSCACYKRLNEIYDTQFPASLKRA